MLPFYLLPTALFTLTALATNTNNVQSSIMNVTFSDSPYGSCDSSSSPPSNVLSIAIRTVPQIYTCFNLNETFSNPNVTYTTGRGTTCLDNNICGTNYTVFTDQLPFNAQANFSHVLYTQVENPFATPGAQDDGKTGRLSFQTYNGEGCQQESGTESENGGQLQPWVQWNCNSAEGQCGTVPYSIQSFALVPTDDGDVGRSGCVLASTKGGYPSAAPRFGKVDRYVVLGVVFTGIAFWV